MASPYRSTANHSALASKWVWFILLGAVFLASAAFVLGNVVAATLFTTWLIGIMMAVGGVVNIIQAFVSRGWKHFAINLLSGAAYTFGGIMIMREPAQGSLVITLLAVIGLGLGGILRVVLALRNRDIDGWWVLLAGGLISVGVGVLLILSLPWSGLWLLGTLVGIELAVQGVSWLAFGIGLYRLRLPAPSN